ncbi:MAG: Ig-like domain-containing protein [Lachnospiraceae bacterium]|nr:Ig-like domain-containing protein [Lachnospiraceae bacterium]
MRKKKLISLFLALCMIFSLIPATESNAAEAKYFTVEKYDENGNGTMLVYPTVSTSWSGRYGDAFIKSLLGDKVKVSSGIVTGFEDVSQDDGWLNNGDLGAGSKWYVVADSELYEDASYFYSSEVTVIRFIYCPKGNLDLIGATTDGAGWASDGTMKVNKDELVKTLSEYDGAALGGNRKAAYDAAAAVLLNPEALAEDVAKAKTNMESASDSATSVTLSEEEMEIYEGQKATLTATLEPGGSTDILTWASSDDTVVSVQDGVIKGLKPGSATITVTAENPDVKDSAEITVKEIGDPYITNMSASNSIAAISGELMLMADIGSGVPENIEWVWSVEDDTIAEVAPMEGNEYLASVKGKKEGITNVIVTVGSKRASFEVEVTPYDGPYVYFEYANGTTQELDENDTITLTCLDEGKFVVGRPKGTTTWSGGSAFVTSIMGGDDLSWWTFINRESGLWKPWDVRALTITVDSGGWSKTFKVDCVASGIKELKTYVGETEVSIDNPYVTEGTVSGVPVTTKGLNANDEWVTIPAQALHYNTSDTSYNFRFVGNTMTINNGGEATMSVFMKDNWGVKAQFIARCTYVPLTDFQVNLVDRFTISGEKDFMTGQNIGTGIYNGNLNITFTPANATNKNIWWENLTPEIATYESSHQAGIVPKKAGTARFKVHSSDNEGLVKEVSITFLYQKPLESAVLDKTSYELNVGDTESLNITTTPADATDRSFTWSYSEDGIVTITDNKIVAKKAGTVTVTGKANDSTQGCADLTFTVKVDEAEIEMEDPLPTAKAGIAHGLQYLEGLSVSKYGDEWNIFTVLRAGGFISDENIAAYIANAKEAVSNGLSQPTDYARVILTLGVLGEDPTNFGGVDLIEKLYNWKDLDYLTSNQISWTLLALDSNNYEIPDDARWNRDSLINMCLAFQDESGGFMLTDTTDVDMTGMILQALAPYNNGSYPQVQAAFSKALTWLKDQMSTEAGFASNKVYNENSCTTAQVLTALSAAGIDAADINHGFTVGTKNMITNLWSYKAASGFYWDKAVDTKGNIMGTQQTTYALEAYRRYREGANSLYDLTDIPTKENVDYREKLDEAVTKAESLTETEYTEDTWSAMAQKLQIARTLLQSGSTDEEQLKEAAENLLNAIDALEKKPEIDPNQEAAEAFEKKVSELPNADVITVSDKQTVNDLIDEYNGKTDEVKGYISEECVNKLNACAKAIADLEEAKKVIEKIDAIGDVTLDSQQTILAARLAFDALTDAQKQIVENNGKKAVLEAAEAALTALQNTAVENVENNIAQFENTANITLGDKNVLKDVRSLYEQLPDSLKPSVSNLGVLEAAEAYMKQLEKENVINMISTLKNPEDLMITDEEGQVTENITAEDISAIGEAKAAYDDLCSEYPGIADEIKALEGGTALIDKLVQDVEIASQYEGYVQAYLEGLIADISSFTQVDDTNVSRAEELIGKYDDAHAKSGVYLDSVEGLAAKAETIRSQAIEVRSALNAASAVDQLIDGLLKEAITSDEMLSQAEAKLAEVDSAYETLSDAAKAYVKNMADWNKAAANVNLYKANKSWAQEIETLVQAAVSAGEENLTDDSTVAAIKTAEAAYQAATKDVQALVKNIENIASLKISVADAKNKALAQNGHISVKETIPYDVVVNIKEADTDTATGLKEELKSAKNAELNDIFILEKYKVSAEGSKQAWDGQMTAVITSSETLGGNLVYLLWSPTPENLSRAAVIDNDIQILQSPEPESLSIAAAPEQTLNYLSVSVDGQKITFTMDKNGVYAFGTAKASTGSDDNKNNNNENNNNENNNNANNNNQNSNNQNDSNQSGTTTKPSGTSTTAKPSGTSTGTGTSTVTSVPKTGDNTPVNMAETGMIILAAFVVLVMLNKKRKTV